MSPNSAEEGKGYTVLAVDIIAKGILSTIYVFLIRWPEHFSFESDGIEKHFKERIVLLIMATLYHR